MITEENCIPLILQQCPHFTERWQEHLEYWKGEEAGLCIDMAFFSRYVIELIVDKKSDQLPEIFALIEQLMIEGDQQVQEAVATCFLENLINASGNTVEPGSFIHLLGPESLAYCQAWDKFTGIQTDGLWNRLIVFGGSPMTQPEGVFTLDEYKDFVKEYHTSRQEYFELSYQNPSQKERKDLLKEQLKSMRLEYRSRLPFYLLARCPICAGKVWEAVDTYSLNGPGWIGAKRGYGWYGTIPTVRRRAYPVGERLHYRAECEHVRIVVVGVNLNCKRPDDIFQRVEIGSERPFIMVPIMKLQQASAVIHTLPVSRFDDPELRHHYTVHFTTYFTRDKDEFDKLMQPAYEERTRVVYSWADYDLRKWVEKGQLSWLDRGKPDLPLCNRPVSEFPYSSMRGYEGRCVIFDGQLEYVGSRPGSNLCEENELEKGFWRQMIDTFLGS